MATISQLMEGKKPGEIKVRLPAWPPKSFFRPFYETVDEDWNGLVQDGHSRSYRNKDINWELYIEPKPKRKLAPYYVEYSNGSVILTDRCFETDEQARNEYVKNISVTRCMVLEREF